MLKIQKKFVDRIVQSSAPQDLFPLLQNAIELEHATIPPYLTALFSLKPGTETEIRYIIHSVVLEEMMHMAIAANILNALGGKPCIDKSDFVPSYPTPLPMGIGGQLVVNLASYSKEVVLNTFMEIEEPEHPLVLRTDQGDTGQEFQTIGEFYRALKKKINELLPEDLPGDPKRQVTSPFFSQDLLFPILKKNDALRAIEIIVEQGEGTSTSPVDAKGEIAHYYRFEELYRGRRLIKDKQAPYGYSFTGEEIPFQPENVYPLYPNTKVSMFAAGSQERRRVEDFNAAYSSLLHGLQITFDGQPEHLQQTMALMYDIKLYGEKLCALPFAGKEGYTIGPSFEYV